MGFVRGLGVSGFIWGFRVRGLRVPWLKGFRAWCIAVPAPKKGGLFGGLGFGVLGLRGFRVSWGLIFLSYGGEVSSKL